MMHENIPDETAQLKAIHEQLETRGRELGLTKLDMVEIKGTICFIPMLPPGDDDETN